MVKKLFFIFLLFWSLNPMELNHKQLINEISTTLALTKHASKAQRQKVEGNDNKSFNADSFTIRNIINVPIVQNFDDEKIFLQQSVQEYEKQCMKMFLKKQKTNLTDKTFSSEDRNNLL